MCTALDNYEDRIDVFIKKMREVLKPHQQAATMDELMRECSGIQKAFSEVKSYHHVCSLQFSEGLVIADQGSDYKNNATNMHMINCFVENNESAALVKMQQLNSAIYKMCCLQKECSERMATQPTDNKLCMQQMCEKIFTVLSEEHSREERAQTCENLALMMSIHCMQNVTETAHPFEVNKMICDFGDVCGSLMDAKTLLQRSIDTMRAACYFRRCSLTMCCPLLMAEAMKTMRVTETPDATSMDFIQFLMDATRSAQMKALELQDELPFKKPSVAYMVANS
ncbi:hypothetical protein CYMTET_48472 [Cymbomonas tetramitiformis]|uniref:Uncharacterized protein n=1 Tax=Cymbomonas tetramitiformis TaxID=36881 RepID=A0AAE0BT92_9CHLO|nr:hypothetical protein CYMTET_48472 [Cymbomonas tetramitiformis]